MAWAGGAAALLHDGAVTVLRERGEGPAKLWCLEEDLRARCFYERRGWRLDGATRDAPFPPHPRVLGYELEL